MSEANPGRGGKRRRRNRRGRSGKNSNDQQQSDPPVGPYTIAGGQLQQVDPRNNNNATKKKRNRKKKASDNAAQGTSNSPDGAQLSNPNAAKSNQNSTNTKASPRRKKHDEATRLNSLLRANIEQNEIETMRDLLGDAHNLSLPLDIGVLESILKVCVSAAMLEEAIHYLRNCTLTGALLSVAQAERVLVRLPQKNLKG